MDSKTIKTTNMKTPKSFHSIKPSVLTDILFHKDKRTELFLQLPLAERIELLSSLTPHVKRDIVMHIPESDLVYILETVDPDEATDILQLLSKRKRERIMQIVSEDVKGSLARLLEFDAETAAGLMTLDYIQADATETISSISKKFKMHEKRTGRPPVILVLKDRKLIGFFPGHELGFAHQNELIGKYTKRIPHISYKASHEDVVQLFHSHPHGKVAVLNDAGSVLGIIYSDDVLKLIQEHEASSLYDFAGISQEESVTDPVRKKVQNRYRWLIINIFTAFLAAFTVGLFEATLQEFVLLAMYMPIVAGMGGNAATQTLAVQVRGIALRQIELSTSWRTLKNELGTGVINGLITGSIVAFIVIAFTGNYPIAFILAMAMIINLIVAAFFGTLVPLVMQRLGKDPAASASIFITTATDVLGFMTFLGLATIILM